VSNLLGVVGEPNRRRLLELLRQGEQTVTQLATQFSVTRPAISQHLGVLAEAGLVEVRREGKYRYYRLNPVGMASLRAALDTFWTNELDQLTSIQPPKRGVPDDD
jgi:DNA-binding transcriptional ArsR family regulator